MRKWLVKANGLCSMSAVVEAEDAEDAMHAAADVDDARWSLEYMNVDDVVEATELQESEEPGRKFRDNAQRAAVATALAALFRDPEHFRTPSELWTAAGPTSKLEDVYRRATDATKRTTWSEAAMAPLIVRLVLDVHYEWDVRSGGDLDALWRLDNHYLTPVAELLCATDVDAWLVKWGVPQGALR